MIKITHLSCGYGEQTIIRDLSFVAEPNQITALIARSGVGKTTILKTINRLHEVEDNDFWLDGEVWATVDNKLINIYDTDIRRDILRRKIGYIFQSPTVLPMSIERNVGFGLKLAGVTDKEILKAKIQRSLKDAFLWDEVKDRLKDDAQKLSLGQMQRLTIARTLVLEPEVLLFDEPTSSLDSHATAKVEELILSLKKDRTLLLVSHDTRQIERLSDKIIQV